MQDARQTDRKRHSEQMAAGSADNQPAAANSADDATDETPTGTSQTYSETSEYSHKW